MNHHSKYDVRINHREIFSHGSHNTVSSAIEACLAMIGSALAFRVRMEGRHALSSFSSARMSANGKYKQTNKQTNERTNKQTNKQTSKQTNVGL